MAIKKNHILVSAGFDVTELDKQMQTFATKFRNALNSSLKNLKIDLTKLNLANINLVVQLDLTQAQKDLDAFRKAASAPLPVVAVASAPAPTPVPAGPPRPKGLPTLNAGVSVPTPKQVEDAREELDKLRVSLRNMGLAEKDVIGSTQRFETQINAVANALDRYQDKVEAFQKTSGGKPYMITDKDILNLGMAQEKLDRVNTGIGSFDKNLAAANATIRDSSRFFQSAAFNLGILGFGMTTLGQRALGLAQSMAQLGMATAKAIEPLQRVENLLIQDVQAGKLTSEELEDIVTQLNRLADIPGANLEGVTEGFRSLRTIGLGLTETLTLLEGLIKSTGRAGISPEGITKVSAQLRQFQTSGKLNQQDLKAIIEQGGPDVAEVLRSAFGSLDAADVSSAGPERFFKVLISGLQGIPAPLATATDKINIMRNSLVRMGKDIAELLMPALDTLIVVFKEGLEPAVLAVVNAFKSLPPAMQQFIAISAVLAPAVLTGIGVILTALGTLGIALSGISVGFKALSAVAVKFGIDGTKSAQALGLLRLSFTQLMRPLVFIRDLFLTMRAIGVMPVFKALTGAGGLVGGLAKIAGLTTPIGIVINLIIALATNAGHARDAVVTAVGGMITAIQELVAELDKLVGGSVWNGIMRAINFVVDIIGGVLGGALATIINLISSFIRVLTAAVKWLNDPSWANFGDVLNKLGLVVTDFLKSLGGTIGAAIAEAIADAFEGTRLGDLIGASKLKEMAVAVREEYAKTFNPKDPEKYADSVDTITEACSALNNTLSDSNKLIMKMGDSFSDVARKFAGISRTLQLDAIKFSNSLRQDRNQQTLDKLVYTDPNYVIQNAGKITQRDAQRSIDLGRQAGSDEIKSMVTDLQTGADELERGLNALGSMTSTEMELVKLFRQVIELAKNGNVNFKQYEQIIKDFNTNLIQTNRDIPAGMNEERLKARKEGLDRAADSVNNLTRALSAQATTEQSINQDAQKRAQELAQKAAEQRDRAARIASPDAEAKRQRLDAIKAQLTQLEIDSRQLKSFEEIQKKEVERGKLLAERADLEKDLGILVSENQGVVDQATQAANAASEQRQIDAQKEISLLEQRIAYNQELSDQFRSNINEALEYFDLLKSLSDIQTGVLTGVTNPALEALNQRGLDAASVGRRGAIGSQVMTQVGDVTRQNRVLGATGTEEGVLEQVAQVLADGNTLSEAFITNLKSIAAVASLELPKLTAQILANRTALDEVERQMAGATPEGRKTLEAQRNLLLEQQTKLNSQATIYVNRTRAVGTALKANADLLKDTFDAQLRINRNEQDRLRTLQEQLSLQTQIFEQQSAMDLRKAQEGFFKGEGGDLAGRVGQNRQERLALEVAAISTRYNLQVKELELQKVQLEIQMRSAGYTQQQIEATKSLIDERIRLIETAKKTDISNTITTSNQGDFGGFTGDILAMSDAFEAVYGNALKAAGAMNQYLESLASGDLIVANFMKMLDGQADTMDMLEATAVSMAAAVGQAFSGALRAALVEGENFFVAFNRMLGQSLINMGLAVISAATAAVTMATVKAIFSGDWASVAIAAQQLPMALAQGGILIGLGTLLGGASGGASSSSSANGANAANSKTGAKGEDFDPEKDQRSIFQKQMMTQVVIDVRHDDGMIVKKVIKAVNNNTRLATLIGNRRLGFQD